MTAVLRVKRKNTDTPLDKLVIACKRARTGSPLLDENEPAIQTVVQFATTLTDPTEDVAQHVAKVMPKINTEIAKVGTKRTCGQTDGNHHANISNKKWIGMEPLGERYKVVNCQRSQDTLKTEEKLEEKWLTLIDVEDSWSVSTITATQNAKETEDIEEFVFDLYCGPTTNDDVWLENNEILVQEPEYPDFDYDDESAESTDDSNAESHWLNDYPDTDYDRSGDEDYDSDYSNNDDYLHVDPNEEEDIKIYGCSYANYRRMIQAANLNNSSSSNSSDDEGRSSNYSSEENESMDIV
ncbi:hypothetical protein EAG_09001 [Camponotus floridanus]|uniref:RNA polymerase II nuclear localization protein SLC7A6OS n=1 Tax=Camponotus floridanus TaxID=104421 RepID=E2AQS8_CAMFO|nr:probable RNA polymerase II nuclear localization protein SLC7A6OS [Camponotus floridanus]XP_011262360.1 probable RNA polymerase II nuclear localization protein SLC7A6OS [Camponotus floridanus]EFN64190.1 hypothetical protein EAG_09001 [Camponotus floridanus]